MVIALAEIGDKSQLVCMTLATRYRPWPVLWGSVTAFALLNLLAVLFGSALNELISPQWLGTIVGLLFIGFGLHAIRGGHEEEESANKALQQGGRSLFFSTLTLISLAELGDKTQLAVAGLSTHGHPVAIWFGATLALSFTSAMGVWAGVTLLHSLPLKLLHRLSGTLFIVIGTLTLFGQLLSW
ncbi:TMEM165/GDT1 family protein [Ectothiorhodospiraceae bacterium BW-2]|nr:TMEM165/GDT1 family protein [Ectothiorhodospiraceae bacterium BW-2]